MLRRLSSQTLPTQATSWLFYPRSHAVLVSHTFLLLKHDGPLKWPSPGHQLRLHGSKRRASKASEPILLGKEDRYNGVILDPDNLPTDPTAFSSKLLYSLKVSTSSLVPIATSFDTYLSRHTFEAQSCDADWNSTEYPFW